MERKNSEIPKRAFDLEYNTQWRREVDWLAEHGIKYVYVRRNGEWHVPTYKYTKTSSLFAALQQFYSEVEAERNGSDKSEGIANTVEAL